MDMKSISGLTYYVNDLDKTSAFYETLGFRFGKSQDNEVIVYLNWFSVKFIGIKGEKRTEFKKEANLDNKGAGLYINIKVENIDECHKAAIAKGLNPSTEPRDWPSGNREFVMRDPDGYKIVFFEK